MPNDFAIDQNLDEFNLESQVSNLPLDDNENAEKDAHINQHENLVENLVITPSCSYSLCPKKILLH